jgi:hypothetical protein
MVFKIDRYFYFIKKALTKTIYTNKTSSCPLNLIFVGSVDLCEFGHLSRLINIRSSEEFKILRIEYMSSLNNNHCG